MSASSQSMGPGGQPLTSAILPPNIFDPRLNGADWYTYETDAGDSPAPTGGGANLDAGAVAQTTVTIDAGTDFYLIALSYFAIISGGGGYEESTNVLPAVTMQLNDSGSTRNLFAQPVPLPAIAGDGKRPFRLIRPRIFRALSALQFQFTSLEPTNDFSHIYVALHGYRKFAGS